MGKGTMWKINVGEDTAGKFRVFSGHKINGEHRNTILLVVNEQLQE